MRGPRIGVNFVALSSASEIGDNLFEACRTYTPTRDQYQVVGNFASCLVWEQFIIPGRLASLPIDKLPKIYLLGQVSRVCLQLLAALMQDQGHRWALTTRETFYLTYSYNLSTFIPLLR